MNISLEINSPNDGSEVADILRKAAASIEDWPGANAFSMSLINSKGVISGVIRAEEEEE